MKNGRELIRQRRTADQQVPKFRSDMTAARDRGDAREPVPRAGAGRSSSGRCRCSRGQFLGANGFQLDYEHLDTDELWRKGRAVGAVIDGKLYLILLDAARSHYYGRDAARFRSDRRFGQRARLADRRDRPRRGVGAG